MRYISPLTPFPLLRAYLIPYALLLLLYLLMVVGGGSWLYLSARQAQAELLTAQIVGVVEPMAEQLQAIVPVDTHNHQPDLSHRAARLYKLFPHLRQISIRNTQRGYGVRRASSGQLVDVELETLQRAKLPPKDSQSLFEQLYDAQQPLYHIHIDAQTANQQPVQMEVAFDRAGLVGRIETSLQSLVKSIQLFSVFGIIGTLLALAVSAYAGRETQKMEARLQAVYQQASLNDLATAFVHDLRNPLASIRANIKNLLITPDETEAVVTEMDEDLLRLEHKLGGFLKLTRPPSQMEQGLCPSLADLIENLLQRCQPLFDDKQLALSVAIDPQMPAVAIESDVLSDALLNLLVNAGEHTPPQGHVWLRAQCIEDRIKITLEDDGSGIPADILPHIFEPFFTTRDSGHGLGLAIVQRIVQSHGGEVSAENRAEGGARFSLDLPIQANTGLT